MEKKKDMCMKYSSELNEYQQRLRDKGEESVRVMREN